MASTARAAPLVRVAVDGPSATGKSDSAQQLAQRLGFLYVDSGALFRALALALSSKLLPASNPSAIAAYLTGPENPVPRIQWTFPPGRIMLNGHDVSLAIRTDEITQKASEYAVLPAVREALIGLQRHIGVDDPNVRGVVMDGRDIGTTVFPDADAKLFLDGDVHVRAARRVRQRRQQMAAAGDEKLFDAAALDVVRVAEALAARDYRDRTRPQGALACAPDAVVIDSASVTLTEQVDMMEKAVRSRLACDATLL